MHDSIVHIRELSVKVVRHKELFEGVEKLMTVMKSLKVSPSHPFAQIAKAWAPITWFLRIYVHTVFTVCESYNRNP